MEEAKSFGELVREVPLVSGALRIDDLVYFESGDVKGHHVHIVCEPIIAPTRDVANRAVSFLSKRFCMSVDDLSG